jgi:hypothetical protein
VVQRCFSATLYGTTWIRIESKRLFDIDAKFADVETVDTCLDYLATAGQK